MKLFKITLFIIVSVLFNSCTADFEEINTNPNRPENVTPDLLLATLTSELPNALVQAGWGNGNVVSQIAAKNNFVGFDTYDWGSETGRWNSYYTRLSEIESILKSDKRNKGYEGVSKVLKALVLSQLTDCWTNIPSSKAIKGETEEIFTPEYDSQEKIYTDIISLLTQANILLENKAIISGDLIFSGNISKWKKLANSLKLRYLMRISKRIDVSSQIAQLVNEGEMFDANSDNAVLKYQGNSKIDSWFMSNARIGSFDEYSLSKTAFDFMKPISDPRLAIWFDKSPKSGDYGAIPNGLNQDNARNFDSDNPVSRFNQSLFYDSKTKVKATIMKYSEVEFLLAEAVQRGFLSGDAKKHYEKGIKATLQYWGVSNKDIESYIANEKVQFDNSIEKIINQKWLALFLVDNQSWFDYRRTGYPNFIKPGVDNINDNKIPVRYLYPDNEKSLNKVNLELASQAIGGDNINSKGWWETGTKY